MADVDKAPKDAYLSDEGLFEQLLLIQKRQQACDDTAARRARDDLDVPVDVERMSVVKLVCV